MSDPKFKAPIVGHFAAADGNCYPVLLHYLVECDGSEPAFVATETDVLSMDALVVAIDPATYQGGGEVQVGPCPELDTIPVYTCTWTVDQTLLTEIWHSPRVGGNAVDVLDLNLGPGPFGTPEDHDIRVAFDTAGNHLNGPADFVACEDSQVVSILDHPTYDQTLVPFIEQSNQMRVSGWIVVPTGSQSWTFHIPIGGGQSNHELRLGPAPGLLSLMNPGQTYLNSLALEGPATGDYILALDDSYQDVDGLGILVWYDHIWSNYTAGASVQLREVAPGQTANRLIPIDRWSCSLPEMTQTVRTEEIPYVLQPGESFVACQELELPEPCCPPPDAEPDKTVVYSCGWTPSQTLNAEWWNDPDTTGGAGGNAFDVFAAVGGDVHDMSIAFTQVAGGLSHVNGAPDDVSPCGVTNTNRGVLAPSYVSGIDGASNESFQHTTYGWIIVPEGDTTYHPAIQQRGQGVYAMYAGPSSAAATEQVYNQQAAGGLPLAANAPLVLDDSYTKLEGLGTLVYVKYYVSNGRGFGGYYIGHIDAAGAFVRAQAGELSCNFPSLESTARSEVLPYTLQSGESFEPCVAPFVAAMTMAGVDYETCYADDDGRVILINTGTGALFETDMSPVPAGVACAVQSSGGTVTPDVVETWVTRAVSGAGTAVVTPTSSPTVGVRSFTVSVEAGRASVRLPNGNTINIRRGSRTWTAAEGDVLDGLPRVTGTTANADFDIVWEEL